MNQVILIGNLTRDPEMRTIPSGANVCNFTIAVNRRRSSSSSGNQPEADFFRIAAWGATGENCNKYLRKGSKVAVTGTVSARAYLDNDGNPRASLEVSTIDVEFLSSRSETSQDSFNESSAQTSNGFTEVEVTDLPF